MFCGGSDSQVVSITGQHVRGLWFKSLQCQKLEVRGRDGLCKYLLHMSQSYLEIMRSYVVFVRIN